MAKDTRVTFDSAPQSQTTTVLNGKAGGHHHSNHHKSRHSRMPERQLSTEDAENCLNEMSESFPALSTRAHKLMRQVSGSFNSSTIKVALILSVILNLLLGIPFGIFFGFWMSQKSEAAAFAASARGNPSSSHSPNGASSLDALNHLTVGRTAIMESCFPCSDIDVDLKLSSRVKVRSKNNICCTNDKIPDLEGTDYFYLTAEYFKRKVVGGGGGSKGAEPCINSPNRLQPNEPVAAAHMMLDVEQTQLNVKGLGNSQDHPWAWIPHDPEQRSFVGKGVRYHKGEITILQDGKYHLYSHVTLSTNDNPLDPNSVEKIIAHSIMRRSRGTPVTILFTQVTIKHNEVRSTNIEGSFDLQAGDVISVFVSHPSFLKRAAPANVFGLFKL